MVCEFHDLCSLISYYHTCNDSQTNLAKLFWCFPASEQYFFIMKHNLECFYMFLRWLMESWSSAKCPHFLNSFPDLLPLGSGLETESEFEGGKSRTEDGVEDASRTRRRVWRRRGGHAKCVGGYRQKGTEAVFEVKNMRKRACFKKRAGHAAWWPDLRTDPLKEMPRLH